MRGREGGVEVGGREGEGERRGWRGWHGWRAAHSGRAVFCCVCLLLGW